MKLIPLRWLFVIALLGTAPAMAWAETLLIERARAASAQPGLPTRGQTSAQVEKKFGAPQEKLEPRGGQKSQWPVINRWVYPEFTVYFERQRVINVVLNAGTAQRGSGGLDTNPDNGWWSEQPAANSGDLDPLPVLNADSDAWEATPITAGEDDWSFSAE